MAAGIMIDSDGKRVIDSNGKHRIGEDGAPCCCWRQARLCSDDTLQDVWMTDSDAHTLTGAFQLGDWCYYFNFADPLGTPGTIKTPADVTPLDSCEDCPGCADFPCDVDHYQIDFDVDFFAYAAVDTGCVVPLVTCLGIHKTYTLTQDETCIWSNAGNGFNCAGYGTAFLINVTIAKEVLGDCEWDLSLEPDGLETANAPPMFRFSILGPYDEFSYCLNYQPYAPGAMNYKIRIYNIVVS